MFTENLHSVLSKRNLTRPIMPKYMRICWLMTAFRCWINTKYKTHTRILWSVMYMCTTLRILQQIETEIKAEESNTYIVEVDVKEQNNDNNNNK